MENKIGTSFDELMFTEFRLVSFSPDDCELDENSLVKAMTVNEELLNIGYTLSPKDVVILSRSKSIDGFFGLIEELAGKVKAAPLYPDFPNQVMEITEAQFRFHHILHYMSTYGMEMIMGTPVEKGWIPYPDAPEKTEKDTRLLEAKVISLVPESDKYMTAIKKATGKKERMTDKELLLVKLAVENCKTEQLAGLNIPFKQNLLSVFYCIFASGIERDKKLSAMRSICQHSGDAWKCIDYVITRKHYHLRTSEKKVLVKLLEMFSVNDFRENIILSVKKAERIKVLLPFISYDVLSRSPGHKAVITDLRDGKLHSWTAKGIELIKTDPDKAIEHFAQRPGELLRRVNFLLKAGCTRNKLADAVMKCAEKLSIQTIITTLNSYSNIINECEFKLKHPDTDLSEKELSAKIKNLRDVCGIFTDVLSERLKYVETGMEGKRVFVDLHNYDLDFSVLNFNERSSEGGYVRSGLAYKLPGNVKRMRFFVYWNHPTRVDLDLHGSAYDHNGQHISIGWNSGFRTENSSIIFSGDITTSDSAEYIDFVTDSDVNKITANINIYSGPAAFKDIEEVFVGVMAVDKLGQEVRLYSPENCFFSHYLTSKCRTINYGYIDTANRYLMFEGKETYGYYSFPMHTKPLFSLRNYLDMLFKAKDIELTERPEDAEVTLIMEKPTNENEISLIDNNFFAG